MKKLLALFLLMCSCMAAPTPKIYSKDADFGELYKSVVLVEIKNNGIVYGSGTAFAYNKDYILTAGHVCLAAAEFQILVSRKPSIYLSFHNNKGDKYSIAGGEIDNIYSDDDICMIKLPGHGIKPVVLGNFNKVNMRDPVVIIGAPQGLALGEFHGKVMLLPTKDKNPALNNRLIVSSAATGGVSGSPVFNYRGEVVGILVMGSSPFDHISICVSDDSIKKFIEKFGY